MSSILPLKISTLIKFGKYNFCDITANLSMWDKFFYFCMLLILFIPQFTFFFFSRGISVVYHQLNVVLLVVVAFSSILYLFFDKKDRVLLLIPFTSGLVFLFSFLGSFDRIFSDNDFPSLFGLYASLTGAQFFSVFVIKHFRKTGSIGIFIYFIFLSGIFIAATNIWLFILLYFGDYTTIFSYTDYIGLGDYIEDLGSFFTRPAGYFFDYHSQYFIPMIALFLVITRKIKLKRITRPLVILFFITSILVSGVKSAYLTLIVCFFYLLLRRLNALRLIVYSVSMLAVFAIVDYFLDAMIYNLGYKIVTHDINIIIEHFTEVPLFLMNSYPLVFLVGGQVDFANYVYSEVYYVTMIYYIGIIGVFLFFLFPSIYLFVKSKDTFTRLLTLIFALSLVHYYVFRISFNVVGTTLFYTYFFYYFLLRPTSCTKISYQ